MIKLIAISLVLVSLIAAPSADKMTSVPGFTDSFTSSVYSGYLKSDNLNRELHYVFVESVKGASNNDPVTLWLNGGPGCSSLLGFLQEIGPYYLQDGVDYKKGDKLIENPYSWHRASNLLFLESPAGVGFSYNLDKSFKYNDSNTASDSLAALKDFFAKFPEYQKTRFYIAGQSYAGKYIPDLAVLIDKYNVKAPQSSKINLIAILVGNGVMTFKTLQDSQIEFMIDRSFVDPIIVPFYYKDCKQNPRSVNCKYFKSEFNKNQQKINPYNVYGYCFYDQETLQNKKYLQKKPIITERTIFQKIKSQLDPSYQPLYLSTAPCSFDDGLYNYFNIHEADYHAKFVGQQWKGPCADITYNVDPAGSMASYQYLLETKKYLILLYNGNWDGVVPFIDTLKGIDILGLKPVSPRLPWFTNRQHSGFVQQYNGLTFVTIKGAAHQAPQTKRAQSYELFSQTLKDKSTMFEHPLHNSKNIQTQ